MTNNTEWKMICKAFAKKIGAELIFVNDDSFGIEYPNGQFSHIHADELEYYLREQEARK